MIGRSGDFWQTERTNVLEYCQKIERAQGLIELGISEKLVHKVFRWQDKRLRI